jgi:hypothetical protein
MWFTLVNCRLDKIKDNYMNDFPSSPPRNRKRNRQLARGGLLISLLGLMVWLAGCQSGSATNPTIRAARETPAGNDSLAQQGGDADGTPAAEAISSLPAGDVPPPVVSTRPFSTPDDEDSTPAAGETETAATPAATIEPEDRPAGALIAVHLDSQVGVLLDDLPRAERDRVAEALLARSDDYWLELARRQIRLTLRRLNFRNFAYPDKGQLPLPPEELWSIELAPAGPARQTIQGHDLVTIDYTFDSTLLTDAESPGAAEPALAAEGGRWSEPFVLPVDPDLLLQRTGNACLNEAGFPPNSYDSENAWAFFDFTCQADSGGPLGCHRTRLPQLSCREAMDLRIGVVDTAVQFRRLAWDDALADAVRLGEVTQLTGPDLTVLSEDLANHRVVYRYFAPDSCALLEQCVSGSGWRRLLQFDATVHNVGVLPMHIGPVVAENPVINLFQYNVCHDHFHFSDYGDFYFAGQEENISSKQAFCVESTGRLSNNEFSPLTHPYTCTFQGVQTGWVDEYMAGLDCQWIDITDVDVPPAGASYELGFDFNPDQFLCEGILVRDADGNPAWEPSGLTTPDGRPIQRPQCGFVPDWEVNNSGSQDIFLSAAGSLINEPCAGQIGPLRNCGFSELLAVVEPEEGKPMCRPGQTVQLSCRVAAGAAPQVLRICEYSELLGIGLACTYLDALANLVIGRAPTAVSFTCPLPRDADEPGGAYAAYAAPLLDEDQLAPISCTVVE